MCRQSQKLLSQSTCTGIAAKLPMSRSWVADVRSRPICRRLTIAREPVLFLKVVTAIHQKEPGRKPAGF
jgi:hypothetical protein